MASLDAEPLLRPFLVGLREHFHAAAGPFATQRIGLAGGRDAWLVARADGKDATVLVVDRDVLAWSKPRPTAGIVAPVGPLVISPRPDGGVALFAYVASLHTLAARMWADDGNAFAEIELASFDACDAMDAAYREAVGWVVVCAAPSGTRAQRLREDGTTAWGASGASLGASASVSPPAVVVDTPRSWILAQRAKGAVADHLLAWRFDTDAAPLWAAPIDLGAVAPAGRNDEKIGPEATVLSTAGGVRLELPHGLAAKVVKAAEIEPGGDLRFVK